MGLGALLGETEDGGIKLPTVTMHVMEPVNFIEINFTLGSAVQTQTDFEGEATLEVGSADDLDTDEPITTTIKP